MLFIPKEKSIYNMCPENEPVAHIEPKSTVVLETYDCFANQLTSEDDHFEAFDWTHVNPSTGPLYINSAEPGDILSVKIESIEAPDQGVIVLGKDMGVTGHILEKMSVRILPIENGEAVFKDLRIPLNKMVGVIGTSPASGSIGCGSPGGHGGNMDCKEIKEGSTVLLPVNVPGALLAVGDMHAVMADGEICGCGLEIPGKVTITIDVIKNKKLPVPMVLTEDKIITVFSHLDLDKAVDGAVIAMTEYLKLEHGYNDEDAALLLSLIGDVKICQVVDPLKTARCELTKSGGIV